MFGTYSDPYSDPYARHTGPLEQLRDRLYDRLGLTEETGPVSLPAWIGALWVSLAVRAARDFVDAYADPSRGNFFPPRDPLPGSDSAAGTLLLTVALAWGFAALSAVLFRYTRARDDNAPIAWGRGARAGVFVGCAWSLGLWVYTLVWLRPV